MKIKSLAIAAALSATLMAPAAANAERLIGSGSTAAEPYLQALFAAYKKVQPTISFSYSGDGGNAGVKDVQNGISQFAGQSVPQTATQTGTAFYQLLLDGLCIDVNSANKLTAITIGQTANIFTGTVTNWSQIPGSGLSTTIDSYGRNSSAGTYTFFTTSVLNGATQGANVQTPASDALVTTAVENDANGIGYAGLAYQGNSKLKALSVNGVPCTAKTIGNESYPLWRYIWLVVPYPNPNPDVVAFGHWVETSAAAAAAIDAVGGVGLPAAQTAALKTAEAKCKKLAHSKQSACVAKAKATY